MARPISKRLLCLTATYYAKTIDEDRNETYGDGVTLSNVWLTTTRAFNNGSNGKESADTMILYYDSVTSKSSSAFTWKLGDKVVFDSFVYYINSITPSYADGVIHHYEIGLI